MRLVSGVKLKRSLNSEVEEKYLNLERTSIRENYKTRLKIPLCRDQI